MLCEKCDYFFQNRKPTHIVCGCARGADTLGERYAHERGIPVLRFPAKWDEYGKRAGYLRNEAMVQNADALLAFWDGQSRGTKHMIDLARQYGLSARIVHVQKEAPYGFF